MKVLKKLVLFGFFSIILLSGCSATSNSLKVVEKIKKDVPALSSLKTGEVSIDSTKAYYIDIEAKWGEIIETKPPKEYLAGIEAQKEVSTILKNLLSQNQDSKDKKIDVSFIGKENSTQAHNVNGLFVYQFKGQDLSRLTDELITNANAFTEASQSGEYFFKQGEYVITCEYGLVENQQELFQQISRAINEIK